EVVDALANRSRNHVAVCGGHRLQHLLVELLVEPEDLAVPVLPGVELVAGAFPAEGRAALEQHRAREQHGPQHGAVPTLQDHFFVPAEDAAALVEPPSAALLNRNWPIRFSSTTADCVCLMRSPAARFFSSAPGSMPTYWSPSRPEVRIFADESRGNCTLR